MSIYGTLQNRELFSQSTVETVNDSETKIEKEDYRNLWTEKALKDNKYWFLETVTAKDALEEEKEESICPIPTNIHQQMLFTMRKVVITIEAGVGTRTVPMLLMESSFQADIRDWASNIYIGSSFSLEMSYYNEKIAVWEPLIEPIETAKGHRSWELMMEISKEHDALELSPEEEEPDEIVFEPPQMSLHIVAQDVLELTVSKTCLDVLTNLGQAFQEAVNKAVGKEPPVPYAPFHVNNYLGVPITIILSNGIFQILDENKDYSCVKLESGCPPLHLTYAASNLTSSNRLSVLKKQDTKDETYFNIMISEEDMTIERRISVACTDKRFFQLPRVTYPGNRWGFVISILSLYGSKFITFHSILQVHNHFSVPIDIYFMKPSLNELEWCCCAEPNKTEYIPLHAIYTSTSELFFKPKHLDNSYTLSLPPFVWRDLTDDPSTQKIVHCKDKKNVGKPFYISVAGEAERIYYEETSRKTMASSLYKLNLNPTAVLRNLLLYPINYSMQGVNENFKLDEGESNDLWAVDLEKIGLEIRISNYLDRNWTCYKILKKEMDELSIWVFESVCSDKTIYLELGMHTQKVKGCYVMQLYSPFCMVNKTGLQLTYRRSKKGFEKFEGKNRKGEDDNIIHHPPDFNPVLFSFKAKAFFAKKKAALRIGDSEWSDKFSLDAVGSSGTVIAKNKEGRTYMVGVQIKLSQAGLTKLVIFTPYYLLVNNSEKEMEVMEVNSSEGWLKIPSNEIFIKVFMSYFLMNSITTAKFFCPVSDVYMENLAYCFTWRKADCWSALWAGGIIGPYFKNDEGHNVTVNGDRCRAMITNFFIPELNNHDVQELWFQQDGATCHTARATIDLLKDTFGDRLISRFGPVNWPPRSCDLTPLDYFLWGYVKSLVYADKPQTHDHLEDNIRRVIADIRPQMLEKVIENWTSRLDYIRAGRGSPMPEIIFKIKIKSVTFNQQGVSADAASERAENCSRFWPKDTTKAEMVVRYVGEDEQTMPFSFKEIHHTLLSLKTEQGGIMVDCQVAQSSVIITFEDYIPGHAAALLVNNLEDLPLVFHQKLVLL
ncbi:vacuolar protein sorting-associated protein 13 [Trichonephila clavipes]|nr:vacuolar protein sorting-associated protein 13 [Trichonephila clavipes]